MKNKVAIVGLGYVGLPLAVAVAERHEVIGFDMDVQRIQELKAAHDRTGEVTPLAMASVTAGLTFTNHAQALAPANFYIIAVPTPIDASHKPDLRTLKQATAQVGAVLSPGDVVVYESTVFPGCTEEECVPILEEVSGLKFNEGFYCGYSPERISPGDKNRSIQDIKKITSGSTPKIAARVDDFYASVITAGTYQVSSIKVAEAAKVIENAQRDLNIAFVNELALIFNRIGIATHEVLDAAGTKWNFLPFQPGLVGGHCIGVDPYYLTHKAESVGYLPQVILAGRRMNDSMGEYVAQQVVKLMTQRKIEIIRSKVLILGLTFKENCSDIRNTQVIRLVQELKQYQIEVDVHDPWADPVEAAHVYQLQLQSEVATGYGAYVLAVAHQAFEAIDWSVIKGQGVVYDVKGILSTGVADAAL